MELTKVSSEVISEKTTFASESENFKYEVITFTGDRSEQVSGSATRSTMDTTLVTVATFNGFGKVNFNIQFNVEMTLVEKVEILTAFDEVITKTKA